jgi:hypothetical protein
MAEIEKGLPGETRTQAKIPGPEDIEIKEEVQHKYLESTHLQSNSKQSV